MKAILIALILSGAYNLSAQDNLVPNSSFEQYYRCPSSFSTDRRDYFLPGWSSPNNGTPDYFHQCSWGDNDVPFNWAGQSNAHTGMGYSGIYTWSENGKNYREYIQCELSTPLLKGAKYKVEFHFKLSSYSVFATDRMGLIFSDSTLNKDDDKLIRHNSALQRSKSSSFTDNQWEVATFEYAAKGGERVLVIGNFSDDRSTHHTKLDSRKGKSFMLSASAYYYIDDVSVIQTWPPVVVETETEIPTDSLVWTDGRKIQTNEIYILKNIQFEFDSYELLDISFTELDKLASVLNERPQWRVELTGHTDDQGSDQYNLELSQHRAQKVGDYLVGKGITGERIQIQGFGKQYPLVKKVDEGARSVNRRVEVRFLK
jgi:outer membrane protein OmpA-like peptidoglycan-associated protein